MGKFARAAILISLATAVCCAQSNPKLRTYFKDYVGLSDEEIASIQSGKAFAKNLHSRVPDEIFVFGAVLVHASPDQYPRFSRDLDRLRSTPGYLAIGEFSDPPRLSDLPELQIGANEIEELKQCKPGHCEFQVPAASMEELQHSVDFSAPDGNEQVDGYVRKKLLERLTAYQRQGNQALGTYNDKREPIDIAEQFKYMLSYAKALPKYLPDFYGYLLAYPEAKPANTEDAFYWSRVKFGLKPTLRIVHVVTTRGKGDDQPAYTIAEKQIYSSHYFETALDLTFCVLEPSDPRQPAFYLVKMMGSEQAGLTGFKGSIVRKAAVGRSSSSLEKSLAAIKVSLESSN